MKWLIVMLLGCGFLGCKARSQLYDDSDAKQVFANDLPGGRDGWREVGLAPQQLPFIFAIDTKCTGFVLDADKRLAMTAQHCGVDTGTPLYFNAAQRRRSSPATDDQSVKGRITAILERSPIGELDYVIFSYEFLEPTSAVYLRGVKLSDREDNYTDFDRQKSFIYLSGYPGDQEAQSRLSRSKCNIRSGVGAIASLRANYLWWKRLVDVWEEPGSIYMQNPAEYRAMRECYWEISLKNFERFHYDCSVYGGNSGGPVYYEVASSGGSSSGQGLADIVVVGLPASYIQDEETKQRSRDQQTCRTQYKAKYFDPVPYFGEKPQVLEEIAALSWNSSNRDTDAIETMPVAIPMSRIVKNSKFLQSHPDLIYQGPTQGQPPIAQGSRPPSSTLQAGIYQNTKPGVAFCPAPHIVDVVERDGKLERLELTKCSEPWPLSYPCQAVPETNDPNAGLYLCQHDQGREQYKVFVLGVDRYRFEYSKGTAVFERTPAPFIRSGRYKGSNLSADFCPEDQEIQTSYSGGQLSRMSVKTCGKHVLEFTCSYVSKACSYLNYVIKIETNERYTFTFGGHTATYQWLP